MSVCLRLSPPKILPWLPKEERRRTVLLLDFDADQEDAKTLRLDLNVVFNPIAVRRGVVRQADYYVGSTGAQVRIRASGGTVSEYTPAATLNVEYSNERKWKRKVSLSLTPEVKVKGGGVEGEAKPGSISRKSEQEICQKVTFASEERLLAPSVFHDGVDWMINSPRGEQAIRDFLIGNLYLFAKCRWEVRPRDGSISVRPSNVLFFDSDRRPLGLLRSILMKYVLYQRNLLAMDPEELEITFQET